MGRYFLHLKFDGMVVPDSEGIEAIDSEAARSVAVEGLRDILAEAIRAGEPPRVDMILIEDETGADLGVVAVGDVVPFKLH